VCVCVSHLHFAVLEANDTGSLLNLRWVRLLACVRDHRL
jgi:hypothetical protein